MVSAAQVVNFDVLLLVNFVGNNICLNDFMLKLFINNPMLSTANINRRVRRVVEIVVLTFHLFFMANSRNVLNVQSKLGT